LVVGLEVFRQHGARIASQSALVLRFRISVLVLGLALLLKWDAG
jgi:hypothetical protein